ncbi:MAG: Rne/Rng family ribonuclease, partial [Paracoccus sp. (in: a-proteobacteria)]|uniref:Rne/Rng family ribonuclease n=1 Tax=Paracoccus sp. TaxID=267 RepID=UPI0026E04796
ETVNKRQLAGNIYLAKVTRVEPSLQAAFVDYGGNRHGFLAFAEIHPDYYQIPAADREALIAEERAYAEAQEAEENTRARKSARRASAKAVDADAVTTSDEIPGMEVVDHGEDDAESGADVTEDAAPQDATDKDDSIESVADEDVAEEIPAPKKPRPRRYKIQEVIKVRQIMLVQVVKEERGNKGAALTTYLSLAGRYCVLMPNTARGGGISRKITNAADRKKLKDIASELEVPKGAGLIIRTAGSQRTRTEIRRDYEYLMRLWEQVRELTFKSVAPAPIYEEGDLIKRSIRDLYSKEIDEVLVEGERGYRTAKDFMKMIMPSHAKNVKHYGDQMPLFARYQVESYLGGMFNPVVQLKSGGYIVIGITEALVAIDVNSGRATKEGSIEDTAYKTNCEAADEIARQLRLRDLAGLIVIDFIDMDERKNNAAVEKRFKEKLKNDRARIQIGKISGFGLMEMSRQRLRPGMLESTTQPCAHCHGTGLIRSDDSLALTILRAIEEEGTRKRSREVLVRAPVAVANFLMNAKREHIAGIEARYGLSVRVEADPSLISPDFALEKFKTATRFVPEVASVALSVDAQIMAQIDDEDDAVADEIADDVTDEAVETEAADETNGNGEGKKRRRRRRRRKGNGERAEDEAVADLDAADDAADTDGAEPSDSEAPVTDEPAAEAEPVKKPRSRRGRGRKSAKTDEAGADQAAAADDASTGAAPDQIAATGAGDAADSTPATELVDLRDPAPAALEPLADATGAGEGKATAESEAADAIEAEPEGDTTVQPSAAPETVAAPETDAAAEPAAETAAPDAVPAPQASSADATGAPEPAEPTRPKRRGWWSAGA